MRALFLKKFSPQTKKAIMVKVVIYDWLPERESS